MVFICLQRWQTQGHVDQGLMDALWSAVALASQVFALTFCLFFCHRLSLRWLCAHALCLHPKQPTMPSVTGPISFGRCAVFLHIPVKQIWTKIKKPNPSFLCPAHTVWIFDVPCTYHAQASRGCEQEKMDYTLNNKRRVICLVMRWAAVHGDHLQEEDVSIAFLEVSLQILSWQDNRCCNYNNTV